MAVLWDQRPAMRPCSRATLPALISTSRHRSVELGGAHPAFGLATERHRSASSVLPAEGAESA